MARWINPLRDVASSEARASISRSMSSGNERAVLMVTRPVYPAVRRAVWLRLVLAAVALGGLDELGEAAFLAIVAFVLVEEGEIALIELGEEVVPGDFLE